MTTSNPTREEIYKIGQTDKKRMDPSAFCESDSVLFSITVPRRYGFIEPRLHVVGDALSGDNRAWFFPMQWDGFTSGGDCGYDSYSVTLSMQELCGEAHCGLFFYHYKLSEGVFFARSEAGVFCQCEAEEQMHQLLIYRAGTEAPDWVKHGIIYHIFVDRFCRSSRNIPPKPGAVLHTDWAHDTMDFAPYRGAPVKNNDFFGGDLWGVADKLDAIAALGATAIYVSPVFDAASNHKYDTGDYEQVDAMFGGNAALENLIAEAKKRNIRIILDGVFNHTGDNSRYFNRYGTYPERGAYQSKESPYYKWYTFKHYPDSYDCWWNIPILPRVNCDEPSYRDYICRVVRHWAKKGIGGVRLDVADELSDSFIETLHKSLTEVNPEAVLYGEVWENATNKTAYGVRRRYLSGGVLDSVMNYPLRDAIIRYLNDGDADAMVCFAADVYGKYPPFAASCLMNFLGTHDTERILTVLGQEPGDGLPPAELVNKRLTPAHRNAALARLRLAYLILIGMPGVPCVFYGDEAGVEGYHDPFNRRPYPWHNINAPLRDYYQMLGQFRRENKTLMYGDFALVRCDRDLLLFRRGFENEILLFCINRSQKSYAVRITGENIPETALTLEAGTGEILPLCGANADTLTVICEVLS